MINANPSQDILNKYLAMQAQQPPQMGMTGGNMTPGMNPAMPQAPITQGPINSGPSPAMMNQMMPPIMGNNPPMGGGPNPPPPMHPNMRQVMGSMNGGRQLPQGSSPSMMQKFAGMSAQMAPQFGQMLLNGQ